SALVDWPKQNRLLQIFDNKDGNLSIFGTLIDHAAPVPAAAPGTNGNTLSPAQLASTGRTIGYNDNQNGGEACGSIDPCGAGTVTDRNVELLIRDPRRAEPKPAKIGKVKITPKKKTLRAGKKTKLTIRVTNSGGTAKKNAKLYLKSSNKRVKLAKKKILIKSIGPGKTVKVTVTIRAKSKAKGKAKITANVSGKKGTANVKIKAKKKKKK
ncbi:MAG: CARDB domain-containing protein, partial [Solirubrobacterales bacterium]